MTVNSSWLDPEGPVTSNVLFGGWVYEGGSYVDGCSWEARELFWFSSAGGSMGFLFCGAIEGRFSTWEHGGRPCWVLGFFTTQSMSIHEG